MDFPVSLGASMIFRSSPVPKTGLEFAEGGGHAMNFCRSIPPTMYTFYFHGHYTTVASVLYFPTGARKEDSGNHHSNQKNKNLEKGIDKGEGFGILTKLSAQMSRAGKK